MLDRLLDSFILGNTQWCTSVLVGVASLHASSAKVGDGGKKSPPPTPTPTPPASGGKSRPPRSGGGGALVAKDDCYLLGGVVAISDVVRRGLLGLSASSADRGAAPKGNVRQRASSGSRRRAGSGNGDGGDGGGGDGKGASCVCSEAHNHLRRSIPCLNPKPLFDFKETKVHPDEQIHGLGIKSKYCRNVFGSFPPIMG